MPALSTEDHEVASTLGAFAGVDNNNNPSLDNQGKTPQSKQKSCTESVYSSTSSS
jgi:hypothetical protein